MDAMATRGWGIALSGAMVVVALVVAVTAPERGAPAAPHTNAPWVAPASQDAAATSPTPTRLVVHFRGRGPLARAERARSARSVAAELSRQRALRGLCFVRFERRGVALRACNGGTLDGWQSRLRAMRAVASVERGE